MNDSISKRQAQLQAIDHLVIEIGELPTPDTIQGMLDLGRLIVDRLYGGDISEWRRRDGANVSFRTLTGHSKLKLSAVTLYRAVGLHELTERLGGLSQWPDLGAAHFRTVIGLPEEDQRSLLDAAQLGHWSVRRMEAECSQQRLGRRRGRRRLPQFAKIVRQMDRAAAEQLLDTQGIEELEALEIQSLYDVVTRLQAQLAHIETKLRPKAAVVNISRRPSGVFEAVTDLNQTEKEQAEATG